MAARVTFILRGDRDTMRRFAELAPAAQRAVERKGLRKGAYVVRREVRRRAPRGRTGNLRKSVDTRFRREGGVPIAEVGFRLPGGAYAHLVEKGHQLVIVRKGRRGRVTRRPAGRVPAHPFFMPAVEASRDDAMRAITEAVKAEIERRAAGGA